MAFSVDSEATTCFCCGTRYGIRKGNFYTSYSALHKGMGYMPVCKECVEGLYNTYLARRNSPKEAARQVCRKLDLFWSDSLFNAVLNFKNPNRSIMSRYISKINTNAFTGKSYDDTLDKEGALWDFAASDAKSEQTGDSSAISEYQKALASFVVTKDVIAFWGGGYTTQMYAELEQRRAYWMSRFPDDVELDIGTEAIIRLICSLELDINRGRSDGKSVDKNVNALNTLLGSANLKPAQKKSDVSDDIANAPLGVKLYHREKLAPLPELEESEKDRKHIKKYIWTWMGHLCKMCGIKNGYTKLYDEEIERLRVKHPEYSDESDEDLIIYDLESVDDASET